MVPPTVAPLMRVLPPAGRLGLTLGALGVATPLVGPLGVPAPGSGLATEKMLLGVPLGTPGRTPPGTEVDPPASVLPGVVRPPRLLDTVAPGSVLDDDAPDGAVGGVGMEPIVPVASRVHVSIVDCVAVCAKAAP